MTILPRLLVLGVLAVMGGCATQPAPVAYARSYPAELIQRETLNVQVFRSIYDIEFTNTTARPFGPSTVWLNARFSKPIDGIAVGQTLRLRLADFRDEHSEAFRTGGFFATETPERLVLAQIQTTGADEKPLMLGLIVVRGQEE
jgi:hypothetical protein